MASSYWRLVFPDRSLNSADWQATSLVNQSHTIAGAQANNPAVSKSLASISEELKAIAARLTILDTEEIDFMERAVRHGLVDADDKLLPGAVELLAGTRRAA